MENGGEKSEINEYHIDMAKSGHKPSSKKKKHRVKSVVILIVLILFLAALGAWWLPLPALSATTDLASNPTTPVSLAWPIYGESAIGAVGYGVLATNGVQSMVPTASVAKLVTALTVLKQYPLSPGQQGPTITLGPDDVASYAHYLSVDGSVVKVVSGEQITEYEALEAMLLPSANNMADSLATWAFGSLPKYVIAANQLVSTLGLTNTVVSDDASGFLPNTKSNAHDLIVLGENILSNEVLSQIVGEKTATVPVAGAISNVNFLLGQYGIIGIKTGNTDQAGGVYVFAAKRTIAGGQAVTVIGSIMGAPTLQKALTDAVPLLNSSVNNFRVTKVISSGQIVGYYTAPWNKTQRVYAAASQDISVPMWIGTNPTPQVALNAVYAPIKSGKTVGSVTININGSTYSSPVTISQSIGNPPFKWRVTRNIHEY